MRPVQTTAHLKHQLIYDGRNGGRDCPGGQAAPACVYTGRTGQTVEKAKTNARIWNPLELTFPGLKLQMKATHLSLKDYNLTPALFRRAAKDITH